jgi:hypothetical protein
VRHFELTVLGLEPRLLLEQHQLLRDSRGGGAQAVSPGRRLRRLDPWALWREVAGVVNKTIRRRICSHVMMRFIAEV